MKRTCNYLPFKMWQKILFKKIDALLNKINTGVQIEKIMSKGMETTDMKKLVTHRLPYKFSAFYFENLSRKLLDILLHWVWWSSPGAHNLRIIAGGEGLESVDKRRHKQVSSWIWTRFNLTQVLGTVISPGFRLFSHPRWSTMRVSVWFFASCALICCALRLSEGAKEQRQCSEVRDATVDQ